MSELRWDARRGEWIITAPHRHDRMHLPPAECCPLCPTPPGGAPTEIPVEAFEFAVLENRFPSLRTPLDYVPGQVPDAPDESVLHAAAPGAGRCEVVVYTPDHHGSLAALPVVMIERLIRVWADRYGALSKLPEVRCVLIFENRGAEIGVTLHHPHGQIYAYPFVPPIAAREWDREHAHYGRTGHCLHCDLLAEEEQDGRRMVFANGGFRGYVPFAARWPYELHLVAHRHTASLLELRPQERLELATLLKRALSTYDALFDAPMPYIMAIRQAPTTESAHAGSHLRIELYPVRRAADKLKIRAGSETSMGVSIHDVGPERAADRLREAMARIERSRLDAEAARER